MQRRPKVDTRPLSFAEDDGLNTPLKSITATTPGNASSSSSSGSPTKQKRATSSSRKARLSSPARILFNYAVKWPLVFLCGYAFILSMLIMYPPIHPFLVYVHWLNFPWNLRNAEVYGFRGEDLIISSFAAFSTFFLNSGPPFIDLSVRSFRFKTIDNVSLGKKNWEPFIVMTHSHYLII